MCRALQLPDWRAIWTREASQMFWSHSWLQPFLESEGGMEILNPFDRQGTCG